MKKLYSVLYGDEKFDIKERQFDSLEEAHEFYSELKVEAYLWNRYGKLLATKRSTLKSTLK